LEREPFALAFMEDGVFHMVSRILAGFSAAALGIGVLAAPAAAASNTATVTVAVTAATQATLGVSDSAGSNISCAVGATVSGAVACTNTATLAGSFRSTKVDTGGTSVSLTGAAITGSGGASIPASALTMTCTGGTTGSPTFPGTAGTLASGTALSTSAVNCQSWTGTIVANYSLVVALSIDAGQVPSDTYTNGSFTATATAN
jgi:hypothetical protein